MHMQDFIMQTFTFRFRGILKKQPWLCSGRGSYCVMMPEDVGKINPKP